VLRVMVTNRERCFPCTRSTVGSLEREHDGLGYHLGVPCFVHSTTTNRFIWSSAPVWPVTALGSVTNLPALVHVSTSISPLS
jgi:hypothetical protein